MTIRIITSVTLLAILAYYGHWHWVGILLWLWVFCEVFTYVYRREP